MTSRTPGSLCATYTDRNQTFIEFRRVSSNNEANVLWRHWSFFQPILQLSGEAKVWPTHTQSVTRGRVKRGSGKPGTRCHGNAAV